MNGVLQMTDPTENRNEVLSVENTDRLRDSHDAAMRIADCSTETASRRS